MLFSLSAFMLFPLVENDFVLAKMLPICTVLNNTTMTVAIANADVLWFFAMLLTVQTVVRVSLAWITIRRCTFMCM